MMERYEKTGHSILYQITHNNIKLHKNQKIWTEFRLNFADRWIILWWRRWKLAPSISISHNHYPVFPLYFPGISLVFPLVFSLVFPLVFSLFDCHDLVPLLMRIEIVGKLLIWITSQSQVLPLFTKIENVL